MRSSSAAAQKACMPPRLMPARQARRGREVGIDQHASAPAQCVGVIVRSWEEMLNSRRPGGRSWRPRVAHRAKHPTPRQP
eukprot:365159-Chlamydomonas_euryale.AAC.6